MDYWKISGIDSSTILPEGESNSPVMQHFSGVLLR